jgi:hypothetical protein
MYGNFVIAHRRWGDIRRARRDKHWLLIGVISFIRAIRNQRTSDRQLQNPQVTPQNTPPLVHRQHAVSGWVNDVSSRLQILVPTPCLIVVIPH